MNSNDTQVKLDASRFYGFVESMDRKTMRRAERDALRKSIRIISTKTKRTLRSRWPGAYSTKGGNRISEGVVSNVNMATTGQLYGQVHIMGTGSTGSRGYILKFFEQGTQERFRKVRTRAFRGRSTRELRAGRKGYSGKIKPLWFFRDSVSATKDKVFGSMDENLQAAVAKQWVKAAAKGGSI